MIKLWIDDCRDPLVYGANFKVPDRAAKILNQYGRNWVWVKTTNEAKEILDTIQVDVLSCDNSLGLGTPEAYTLLDWLEEKAATDEKFHVPPHIYVHSSDPNRVLSMEQTIESIKRFRKK